MESILIKIGLILKWLIPAAVGSGMAIFLDKSVNTTRYKIGLFIFGVFVSAFFGGTMVEYWDIKFKMMQAAIYFSWALWGCGIIVQINDQMPEIIRNFFAAITNGVTSAFSFFKKGEE